MEKEEKPGTGRLTCTGLGIFLCFYFSPKLFSSKSVFGIFIF
jgi:hypothetical protein